jgi:hypothetical protein
MYWKQKNGNYIAVDQMDINHLRSTLKFLIRNSPGFNPVTQRVEPIEVKVPVRDIEPRGEIAEMLNEESWDCDFYDPRFSDLLI